MNWERIWALPIIAVSSRTNRDIKLHLVINIIGLGLPQIPLDT